MQSPEVKDLFAALSKAQSELKPAIKDAENPHFRSRFADLESVWEACRAPLAKHGLTVIQTTDYQAEVGTVLVTTLGHSSGQWIKGTLPLNMVKQDPQAQGSAITYARRYALAAILGIVQTDDDAEQAMPRDRAVNQGPAPKPAVSLAPSPKAPVKPRGKIAEEPAPELESRDELNRKLMALYRPYLTKFPETKFHELLYGRYSVQETRLMTVEQVRDLIRYMEETLNESAANAVAEWERGL